VTVPTSIVSHSYSPGAAMAAEAIPFCFLSSADVVVVHVTHTTGVRTTLVPGTDYAIAGDGPAGAATITAAAAWPALDVFEVIRETANIQPAHFPPHEPLQAAVLEQQLDRMTLVAQETAALGERSLRVPPGETAPQVASLTDAEGKVLAMIGGVLTPIENDAAAAEDAAARAIVAAALAVDAGASAEVDANRAELAAAAAALSAGIYINEATGRAAVANGVVFAAVGTSGDKAVDIWQRVNAGASTLLRSYPSLDALNAALAALAAAVATAATKAELKDATSALKSFSQESAVSLPTGMADSLSAERMLDPVTYIDKITGVDAAGRGTRSYKAVQSFGYIYNPAAPADTTVLFRNGQQHMLIPNADGNSLYIGNITHRTTIAGYGPEGNYGACLDTRMPLAGQIWTASGGGWSTTVMLRNSLNFGTAGANIAGVHLMLWNVPAPHDDVLGSQFELKIGNANPAANDAAVDATADVDAWSIKYVGQVAGEIRGLPHVGDTYVLHIKLADGSDPNGKPLFLADFNSGVNLTAGAHGHVVIIGTTGKDSANFAPMGNASLGQIPWFESLTMLGVGGHGGVGPKCTVGDFRAVGVPIPGENTYSVGQTGGGGCHNFSAGFNLSNQYLYNGSIHTYNFGVAGCYAHGSGGGGEAYRGWNVGGDIVQDNCTAGFEIEITLNEGFKHYGRLILTGGQTGVNSYPGQYFQLAGRGGLFKPGNFQATLASFTGSGARTTIIGSDNPDEIFILDAALVNAAAPDFHGPKLYARSLSDMGAAPTLILKHVEDHTVVVPGVANKFQIPDSGFDPNNPYVNLHLIGSKLGDMWPAFDFAPHWPSSLYIDGNSEIGFHGRTWAQIEAAMAALGNTCTILPGAKAVNAAGDVVDIKT